MININIIYPELKIKKCVKSGIYLSRIYLEHPFRECHRAIDIKTIIYVAIQMVNKDITQYFD